MIITASMYCVQLDNVYDDPCSNQNNSLSFDCQQYNLWRNYSIVAMFVGSLTLLYSLAMIFAKFSEGSNNRIDRDSLDCLIQTSMLVIIICFIMISVTFGQLIKSRASTGDTRVASAAVATIVMSGVGMCVPCIILLCDFVFIPIRNCVNHYTPI